MTHTHVMVQTPTPWWPVFEHARGLTGAGEYRWDVQTEALNPRIWTTPDQELPAHLEVTWGADGPIQAHPEWETNDPAEDDPDKWYQPSGFVRVTFAAPGYDEDGATADDLLAWLVRTHGAWLTDRGLTWSWYQEYTDQWRGGPEQLHLLGDADRGALPHATAASDG